MLSSGLKQSPSGPDVFNEAWNKGEGVASFRYTTPDEQITLIIKAVFVDDMVIINGLIEGHQEHVATLSLSCSVYVNGGTSINIADWANIEDWNIVYKNVNDLRERVQSEIIGSLLPSFRIAPRPPPSAHAEAPTSQPNPLLIGGPRMPQMPMYGGDGGFPDLGFDGDRLPAMPGMPNQGRGVMQVGPNHPAFFGRGRGGQSGFPPGHPPGARFDPYGPFGNTGFGPDNDELPPPGPGMGPGGFGGPGFF